MNSLPFLVVLGLTAGLVSCASSSGNSAAAQSTTGTDESGEQDPPSDIEVSERGGAPVAESGDGGECAGAATQSLLETLRARGEATRTCFHALAGRGTEARGQVKVTLQISSDGAVQDFGLEGDQVGDAKFIECLAQSFDAPYTETPPESGCVRVKVPLKFSMTHGG